MAKIRIPYAFDARPYQVDFLASPAKFKIAVWNRRAGKSMTALNAQVARAVEKKGLYYYILPTYRAAKQVMWDTLVRNHIPPEVIEKKNDSELAIYYINGSIQRFVGCEDPDKHRGINPIDVVFDEYSEMSEEMWTAIIQPILRENGGTATFIFTPKGKNHAWKLVQLAKDNPEWWVDIKGIKDTKIFTDEQIAEIKKNTPQALFAQEYESEFMEGAGQFFRRIKENIYHDDPFKLPTMGDFQVGVDLAKYNDWTVITPFNRNKFVVYPQDRFNQVDWNLQKARIQVAVGKLQNAKVCIDRTGAGEPIVEDLKRVGVNIPTEPFDHAFVFTQQSRDNLLRHLAILLEQDKIKIPNDEALIAELESFRYELSDRGTIKVSVPEGLHDDRVVSLALAVYGNTERVEYTDPRTVMLRDWEQAQNNTKNFAR